MGVLSDIGINWSMPDVNWANLATTILMYLVLGILLIGGIAWVVYTFHLKKTYTYPITLISRRNNGTKTRHDLFGGLVAGRGGIKDFKIRLPKTLKRKSLGYIPNFSLADSDDRLTFIQDGDGTMWQQCKTTLITEKEVVDEKGNSLGIFNLLIEPIPTDVKTVTYNNMQSVRDLVDMKKLTAFGIAMGAFIIMVIAHLISLFIQTKIKCGVA